MTQTTKQILIEARALISDPEHWCQHYFAHENTGREVRPDDPEAYGFCAYGALYHVAGTSFNDDDYPDQSPSCADAVQYLIEAANELFGADPAAVNDGEVGLPDAEPDSRGNGLAHANVLRVFDRAIEFAS